MCNDAHARKVLKILNIGRTSQEHPILRDARFEGKTLEPLWAEGAFDEQAIDLGGREGGSEGGKEGGNQGVKSVDGHVQG